MKQKMTTRMYTYLDQYTLFSQLFSMLRHTPKHAAHWYLIVTIAFAVVVINVSIAGFTFVSISTQTNDLFRQSSNAATISRSDLQEALETFQSRAVEYGRLEQTAPLIVDPGR